MLCLLVVLSAFAQPEGEQKKTDAAAVQAVPAPLQSVPKPASITIPQPFIMKNEGGNVPPWWLEYVKTIPTAVVTAFFTLGGVLMAQRHGLNLLEKQQAHTDGVKRREMQWSLSERIVTEMATLVTTEISGELAHEDGQSVKKHLEEYNDRLVKFMVVTELAAIILSREASALLKGLLEELAEDDNIDRGQDVTQKFLERFQKQIRTDLGFS
ncbi:MAG: hypothetical protein ACKV2U_26455 [Bryobacteraceae bacterium]